MTDFENTEIAFQHKSKRQLKKAYWLFRLLANPIMVNLGSILTHFALVTRLPVKWALKPTVFNHFCGGETIDECNDIIRRQAEAGVLTILDYSAEGKENETDFEHAKLQIISTIDKAANDSGIPFAVFKPTGLSRVALLEKVQAGLPLTGDEQAEFGRVRQRFEYICAHAALMNVPVMIDSEESWIQEAVDRIVEGLMEKHNKEKPLVYNTLQIYRHDRLGYLKGFTTRAREQGIHSAFKLVRGAYMEKERERAVKLGYPSPIHPDKKATDEAFDAAVAFCLQNHHDTAVCIATHNEKSCLQAVDMMSQLKIPKNHPYVSFAQLLGMSDHISYNLAAAKYNVCKYVPYGPVKTVIPYLIRRAEENTSVAGQTTRELFLIKKELVRRRGVK